MSAPAPGTSMPTPIIVATATQSFYFSSLEELTRAFVVMTTRAEQAEDRAARAEKVAREREQAIEALEYILGEHAVHAAAYRLQDRHETVVKVMIDTGLLAYAPNPAAVVMHKLTAPLTEVVRMTERRRARKV